MLLDKEDKLLRDKERILREMEEMLWAKKWTLRDKEERMQQDV